MFRGIFWFFIDSPGLAWGIVFFLAIIAAIVLIEGSGMD